METIEVRRSIAAPIADVFDWISNAGNYTDSPLFLAAKLIRSGSAAAYGVGAIRRFTFPLRLCTKRSRASTRPIRSAIESSNACHRCDMKAVP